MKRIFESFRSEVNYRVHKLYFEITARDSRGNVIISSEEGLHHQARHVEIDVFLMTWMLPFLIDAEIEFAGRNRQQAIESTLAFRANADLHPAYFGDDVSDMLGMKARNIALSRTTFLERLEPVFEEHFLPNVEIVAAIHSEFATWTSREFARFLNYSLGSVGDDDDSSSCRSIIAVGKEIKVLLNAEAFGFGPTAAIAEFFPYLRDRIEYLSFIGAGHPLQIQRLLPYDEVHDYSGEDLESSKANFLAIAKEYDVFITACDFVAAEWAKELGLKVVVYDPLVWYWENLPDIVGRLDLYIAQNFFGVEERLSKECAENPEYVVVPAVVSGMHDVALLEKGGRGRVADNLLLVNLGGLSNPFLEKEDLIAFVRVLFRLIRDVLQPLFAETVFATSEVYVNATRDICDAKTFRPQQVQHFLGRAKMAIMTSGLGNLFEASAMRKTVCWIPPTNDSQGQQVKLLQKHGMVDVAIDWHTIFPDMMDNPIDYFGPQKDVIERIAGCMRRLTGDAEAQARFGLLLQEGFAEVQRIEGSGGSSALSKLAEIFQVGGAKLVAENLIEWLRSSVVVAQRE